MAERPTPRSHHYLEVAISRITQRLSTFLQHPPVWLTKFQAQFPSGFAAIALIGWIAISCVGAGAQRNPAHPNVARKRMDFYRATLTLESPPEIGMTVSLTLKMNPLADAPNTRIRLFLPQGVALRTGDLASTIDLENNQPASISYGVEVLHPGNYTLEVRVTNEHLRGANRSYYLHIQSAANGAESSVLSQAEPNREPVQQSNPEPRMETLLSKAAPALVTCSAGNVRIRGRQTYLDEDGSYLPVRRANLDVREAGLLGSTVLTTTATDNDGYYSVCLSFSTVKSVFIRVYNESDTSVVKTCGLFSCSTYYGDTPTRSINGATTADYDFGSFYFDRVYPNWQAMDNVTDEYQWISDRSNGDHRGKVEVRYPDNHCSIPGCAGWPCSDGDHIYLPDKTVTACSWDKLTVYHEYGHSVMYFYYGNSLPFYPQSCYQSSHSVYTNSCQQFAIIEGWAEFMESAVANDANSIIDYASGCSHYPNNIETNWWWKGPSCDANNNGANNEGAVAGILWHIFAPGDSPSLGLGFNNSSGSIWQTIKSQPSGIEQFKTSWLARYGFASDLSNIYRDHGISPPTITSFDIQPRSAAVGTQLTATVVGLAGSSPLSSALLLRTTDLTGTSGWTTVATAPVSGSSASLTLHDTPPAGTYLYGAHLVDSNGEHGFEPQTIKVSISNGTGTIQVTATLNGSAWSGALSFDLSGPSGQTGTSVPQTLINKLTGVYTVVYLSGGPSGAALTGITPSSTQTLSAGGTSVFTLNFIQTYTLAVNSSNPASGVVITVSPADKNGSGNGSTSFTRTYNSGTMVTLTAPSTATGKNFSSWTGCDMVITNTCSVTMSSAKTVTANYTTPTYNLTVNSSNPGSGVTMAASPPDNNGGGTGTTSFTRTYNSGTMVTLTAPSTASGNNFSSWTGCDMVITNTCSVTMSSAKTVTANYTTPTYNLTVNSSNPGSGVPVTVSPADKNGIGNGSTSFTRTYNSGTMVTLTAPSTASGNNFSSWSGCNSVTNTACSVTINSTKTVTANYATPIVTYTLTVNSSNPGSGVTITVSPPDNNGGGTGATSFTRTYNSGAMVTLVAPLTASGNNFSSWTGCDSAPSATCTVTMNAAKTATANYDTPVKKRRARVTTD